MPHLKTCLPIALALALTGGTASALASPPLKADRDNAVPQCTTSAKLMAYLRSRNPTVDPRFTGIAAHYARIGQEMGLRWDYAFFQMIVETASLSYIKPNGRPAAVAPHQNNFAGIGAPGNGAPGESFGDIATGVRAHLQHVTLYAGERVAQPIAERTRKVQEWGVIANWQRTLGRPTTYADLARKWSPDTPAYSTAIESVASRFYGEYCVAREEPAVADARYRQPPTVAQAAPVQTAPAVIAQAPVEQPSLAQRALRSLTETPPPPKAPRSALGLGASSREALPTVQPLPQQQAGMSPSLSARLQPAPIPRPSAMQPPAAAHPDPSPAALRPTSADDAANEALRQLVSGRTVLLDTPIGTVIPIQYNEDGVMSGKAGGLAGYLGAANDKGQWWVEKAKLCQKWNVWFKGEQQCLKFRQSGKTIHWIADNGKSGTAKLAH